MEEVEEVAEVQLDVQLEVQLMPLAAAPQKSLRQGRMGAYKSLGVVPDLQVSMA